MTTKSQKTIYINHPLDATLEAVERALYASGAKVTQSDRQQRLILAKKGAIFQSWGEIIRVTVDPLPSGRCEIHILSQSALRAMVDWGKNAKNIASFEQALLLELQNFQPTSPIMPPQSLEAGMQDMCMIEGCTATFAEKCGTCGRLVCKRHCRLDQGAYICDVCVQSRETRQQREQAWQQQVAELGTVRRLVPVSARRCSMSLESELQRVKREQELALQAAQEAERKAQAHRSRLRQAILSQRQALVADWTKTVAALLDALGKSTWGEDAYTLIEPDGVSSLSWFVVHVEGETKGNYQVTLQLEEASSEDLSLSPEDRLVRPIGFVVAGAQEHTCSLSQESLKEALVLAYKGGPKGNGLDLWSEAILAKSPYKKGEYEATNKWMLLSTLFTLLAGVLAFLFAAAAASDSPILGGLLVLIGLGMLVISAIALRQTSWGKRFRRLPTGKKALAIIAAAPGALMAFVMSAGLIVVVIAILVLLAGASREERVSEIEEGVRRAIR